MKKLFENHIFHKGFISGRYEELLQLNKDWFRCFPKEDIRTSNIMEMELMSSVIKGSKLHEIPLHSHKNG